MNCNHYQRLIPAYLSGELSNRESEELKGHLDNCPFCRKDLAREQALSFLLDEWDCHISAIDISQNVMSAVVTNTTSGKKRKVFSLVQDLIAAAVAVIIIFTSINTLADKITLPNYDSAIGSVSNGINGVIASYIDISSNAVNSVLKLTDEIQILPKEDEF